MAKTQTRTKATRARMHGLYAMRDRLTELTERAIDPDSDIGRELAEWKAAWVEHLGGEGAVSVAQRELIDLAAAERLILSSIDAYICELGAGVINRRHRKLYPIVEARGRQADRYQRRLDALNNPNIKPRPKTVTALDYIQGGKND